MSQYLQRLATRNLNVPVAAGMRPAARTMSPIAEEDQRVGMQGFEDFQFGAGAVAAGRLEDTSGTAGELSGIAPRKIDNPINAGKSSPRNFIGDGQPVIGDERATELSTTEIRSSNLDVPRRHFHDRTPSPGQRLDEAVVGPRDQVTGLRQSGWGQIDAGEITPNADPPPSLSASPRSTPASLYRAEANVESGEIEASGSRLRRPSAASPQLLEPRPRAIVSQQQRGSIFPDDVTSSCEAEPSPRVVIGRINVEVVAPPVEPKASSPSRPGPVTAESVSVIGPLSRGVRSNLRLSLRHR